MGAELVVAHLKSVRDAVCGVAALVSRVIRLRGCVTRAFAHRLLLLRT